MIRTRLLLDAQTPNSGGGGAPVVKEDTSPSIKQPTAEALKVNFNTEGDGDITGDEPSTTPEPKSAQTAAKVPEVKQQEVKTEEVKAEAAKPTEVKTDVKPSLLAPRPAKQQARDYTGFSAEETKILKSMSNEAYEHVAPILKKSKEPAVQQEDRSYLQHPQGYTLHPDYQRSQAEATYAGREARAWQEQIVAIKEGKEFTPLTGVDPKTGEFVYGVARPATAIDEEQCRVAMNKCIQAEQAATARVQQIPQQFNHLVAQDLQNINAERAKRFDWVANPELMKHELEIEGVGKQSIQKIQDDFYRLFPPYHRNTVGVKVAADLFVAMQIYAARVREAEQGKAVAETLKDEATRVEPSSSVKPAKPAESRFGVTEFSMDGMPT